MQTKQTSDAYRSNYDAIFRKNSQPTLDPIPEYGDLLELNEGIKTGTRSLILDGIGYFATESGYSKKHPFGYCENPPWATHLVLFSIYNG